MSANGLDLDVLDRYGLTGYGPVLFDSWCGEPVAWGHSLTRRLTEDKFNELHRYGHLEYGSPGKLNGTWVLVTKRLTKAEAIEKYGPITHQERGPRGGFKFDVYGETRFLSKFPE